ncbi:DMT family transporter [Bacillus sp. DTU_2020_1000418_1_SI_GHA_SEK_038]|uniref:EamA family transporter n=1 Tax=Bacillus sp. DTU_2020_1000418_1_SI_GHA_SEK_038 TaxID=3077585 RepID=UPI0028E3D070|nr:DMT family transporter [Bacillus sp. DTU_2020_1000418_1_SI_GHA_SEK_038]WNS75900.1 DMT family transporter [Bacillus sp. DTU_2020_1000418_1_SI_GHA_SEK_038]
MNSFKYSLFIFIGACSYGILASIVKTGLTAGHTVYELTGSQYLFGFLLLLITFPFIKRIKISFKQAGALMLTGTALSLTGIFYGLSLERVSASLAIVLLFQFTWIGILIEAIYEKKMPSKNKILSVVFLIVGTIFASNLLSSSGQPLQIDGLVYGLLSAVTYAVFIFASGKVAKEVPTIQRSLFITLGGLIVLVFIAGPMLITNGIHLDGLWKYSLSMAFFGAIFPIVLFAIGTPKIDAGLAAIVGSAELPAAIVAAMLILGERISGAQTIGIALILIGISIPQLQFIKMSRNRLGT